MNLYLEKTKQLYSWRRHSYSFGFPKKLANDGPFWTSCYDKKKLTKIMDYLRTSDDKTWNICRELF